MKSTASQDPWRYCAQIAEYRDREILIGKSNDISAIACVGAAVPNRFKAAIMIHHQAESVVGRHAIVKSFRHLYLVNYGTPADAGINKILLPLNSSRRLRRNIVSHSRHIGDLVDNPARNRLE